MAAAKKTSSKPWPSVKDLSVGQMIIFGSFAANIAFVVVWVGIATTNVLDGIFMENNLIRYCATANDHKLAEESSQVRALREYVCDRPQATTYFHEGFNKYLDSKGIPRPVTN